MIGWVGACFLLAGFLALMRVFKLLPRSRDVVALSRQSYAVITDTDLSDDEKEVTLQSHARQLLGHAFLLTAGAVLAAPWLFGAWESWWFWPFVVCLFASFFVFAVRLLGGKARGLEADRSPVPGSGPRQPRRTGRPVSGRRGSA